MTVNSLNITSGPYVGNDIATQFSYTFRVEDKTQLSVFETDLAGVRTELTVDTDYTVASIGNDAGGLVTRVAGALPLNFEWFIRANYKATQLTAFPSQGPFFPDVHEASFDQLTFLIQQLEDSRDRSFRLSDAVDIDGTFTITDDSAARVGKFLSFDTNGDLVVASSPQTVTTDLVFGTKALLQGATINEGLIASTRGYYPGWPAFLEPQGAGTYVIALLSDVRTAKSDPTFVPDGGINFFIANNGGTTHVAMLMFDGVLNLLQTGAKFDGTTDDLIPIQAGFDYADHIVIPPKTARLSAGITKTGQFWTIEGSGTQLSILNFDAGTFDLLSFDNGGTAIARSTLKGFMVQSAGDKTAGASINFIDAITNCHINNMYVRLYWDAFKIAGCSKSYFRGVTYDQIGRTAGTRGQYGFNCPASKDRMVDWHLTDIQGSGFVSGATPLSSIDAHFFIVGCDGIYMENFHFFFADRGMRFQPNDVASLGDIIASVHWSNGYWDTMELNHLYFAGTASVAYKKFFSSNVQYRDAQSGDAVTFQQTGDVDIVEFDGGGFFGNDGSGIRASNSPDNVTNLSVTGVTFDDNNKANDTVAGDIITRGNNGTFTGNTHIGGGALGHAIRILSGATSNTVTGCDLENSTATDKLNDAGTGTKLYALQGFVIDNKGSATINNPSTSVVVAHGLDVTPSQFDVRVTPISNLIANGVTSFWVTSVDATNFTINVDTTPSSTAQFSWKVTANT